MLSDEVIRKIQEEIIEFARKRDMLLLPSSYKKLFLKYAKEKGFSEEDCLNIDKELAFEKLTVKSSALKSRKVEDIYVKMGDTKEKLIIYIDDSKKELGGSIEGIKQKALEYEKHELNKKVDVFIEKYSGLMDRIRDIKDNMEGIEKSLKSIDEMSIQDSVTLMGNCKYFEMSFEGELYILKRYKTPVVIVVLRMKNIEQINQRYGESVKNTVIKSFANIIYENIRSSDVLCSCGNGDFRLILHNTDLEKGQIFAQKLKYLLNRIVFQKNSERFKVNVAYGLTQLKEDDTVESALMRIMLKQ